MRIITRKPRPGVGKAGQTGGQDFHRSWPLAHSRDEFEYANEPAVFADGGPQAGSQGSVCGNDRPLRKQRFLTDHLTLSAISRKAGCRFN